jgi:amidase
MNRRRLLTVLALAGAILVSGMPAHAETIPPGLRSLNIAPFEPAIKSIAPARVAELDAALTMATIPQVQALFQQGRLTSEELVKYYLWRINKYDYKKLNSVTELNPDALEIARQLDAERAAGKVRGPLHGTVVLLKDNIGTGDKMHTTAGAAALIDAQSDRDAFLVKRLRDAGVVVLGKTGLTEFANWVSDQMPQGWNAVNGVVKNPYGSQFNVWGSSTGSAVAAPANLATFTIGTETWGSLTAPAAVNFAVTLKPTLGIVSRDRVIPITDAQDSAGPITRNVTDLALVMNALTGQDRNDYATIAAKGVPSSFDGGLSAAGLKGMRIAMFLPLEKEDLALHGKTAAAMRAAGATVIELPALPDISGDTVVPFFDIGFSGFKNGLNAYLQATNAPIKSVDELVAFNAQDPAKRVPFGQPLLENSAKSQLTAAEYAKTVQAIREKAQKQIDGLLAANKADLLATVNTDLLGSVNNCGAGYPGLVIPVGFRENGQPMGVMFVGTAMSDAKLIRAAFALEQQMKAWQPPDLTKWK